MADEIKTCKSGQMGKLDEQESKAKSAMEKIPHKVFIMSGKGGVGKTTLCVNLACALADQGLEVGILDTDLHGPNVALMTGIEGERIGVSNRGIVPVKAFDRVRVLSMATFLPSDSFPVAWRGPRKSAAIRQFIAEGDWEGLDVLLVDCPPGTGDEPMTVVQLIQDADGAVIVTSPQDVALLDSRKCVNFVRELDQKVLGIVENLSGFVCPSCGTKIDLFKSGGGFKAADGMGVPFLGSVPISAEMVNAGDEGKPLVAGRPTDVAAKALCKIAEELSADWPQVKR